MIVFSEIKTKQQSIFSKSVIDDEGNEISKRTIRMPIYHKDENGFTYYILYDDHMNIIHEFFDYINHNISDSPLTSRQNAAFSLRLLFCFLSLKNIELKDMNNSIYNELKRFLKGLSLNINDSNFKSQRSNNTVNNYFATYRHFIKAQNIDCEILSTCKNLKSTRNTDRSIPKYLSPNDFGNIYRLSVTRKDKLATIIMHLMYVYGLRLGEVLGLTFEDIKEVKRDNKLTPILLIRNRKSDKKFQFAKGKLHVTDTKQYKSSEYHDYTDEIILTYHTYEKLIAFIEELHSEIIEKYPNNYDKGVADIVSRRNIPDSNHYVFLNQYGRILSDQTWNNRLKLYFKESNIPLDFDRRKNNLSHRFRHGFAMYHAHYRSGEKARMLELQKLMRHKSITSTQIYYNPTPEDELKIKTGYLTELYKLIPELKEGIHEEKFD